MWYLMAEAPIFVLQPRIIQQHLQILLVGTFLFRDLQARQERLVEVQAEEAQATRVLQDLQDLSSSIPPFLMEAMPLPILSLVQHLTAVEPSNSPLLI